MKLYYILIAFAFVNVVFAFTDFLPHLKEDHKKQVVVTNIHINSAYWGGRLPNAVKHVICEADDGVYKYSMVDMVFMMAILPESVNDIPTLIQYIKYQTDMQNEIAASTSIGVPVLPSIFNYGNRLLEDLRRERKYNMTEAIIHLILKNIILPGPDFNEAKFGDVCRAVGLFKSVINPNKYIVSAEVNELNTCIITDVDNRVSRYEPIDGRVYQIGDGSPKTFSSEIMAVQFIRRVRQ
ncbi:uncharacterized protein LOC126832722 [Adelges cooleyi]|uniref:uncharacterized protein LOC126832722 n=1 Tax=Adelges cooleyi TaxID=133065 RepID=UPI0021803CB7|nr:uncharacterized protein LOC126832722 [Adelges cooleyi]